MSASLIHRGCLFLVLVLSACGGPPAAQSPQPPPPATEVVVPAAAQAVAAPAPPGLAAPAAEGSAEGGPVPVTAADPTWGSSHALVTIVEFADFQCPFCKSAADTLRELRGAYGPEQLRIVWKNNPLTDHPYARGAAEAGMVLQARKGSTAFWSYHDALFNRGLTSPEVYQESFQLSGLARSELAVGTAQALAAKKVDDDMALAKNVGVNGAPAFFINGVFINGAQPVEEFRKVIDDQLARGRALVESGTPQAGVYAQLTTKSFADPKKAAPATPVDDKQIWRVPVGSSPARGSATALVTLVEFSDFQCPFCARVTPTLKQLETEYGPKLRIVWKNLPLSFHTRAEPAAELAIEARAQKGDAAFWAAHDALFAAQSKLADADLEALAKTLGLNATLAMKNVLAKKHAPVIAADVDLADDVQAHGTPNFFINGRRLTGAQPIETFRAVINEQLAIAEAEVQKGVAPAKVYESLQKNAIVAPPPEKKTIAAPTKDNPSRGPQNAKVVVQMFADFECPFCKRVLPTLKELDAAFPGKIRFVWRNHPLSFHTHADLAAEAAMEAFHEKGAAGFWKMHDLLFEAQGTSLERAAVEQLGQQAGLDPSKLRAALDTSAHKAIIDADAKAAVDAKMGGTPAFVINGYFLSGAQPLAKFKKIVALALREAK